MGVLAFFLFLKKGKSRSAARSRILADIYESSLVLSQICIHHDIFIYSTRSVSVTKFRKSHISPFFCCVSASVLQYSSYRMTDEFFPAVSHKHTHAFHRLSSKSPNFYQTWGRTTSASMLQRMILSAWAT